MIDDVFGELNRENKWVTTPLIKEIKSNVADNKPIQSQQITTLQNDIAIEEVPIMNT